MENYNEDFCTYEQSVKLKELGFNWDCYKKYGIKPMSFGINVTWYKTEWTDYPEGYLYDKEYVEHHREEYFIPAPTLYQCQKWFREIKQINIEVIACYNPALEIWEWDCFISSLGDEEINENTINHSSYEKALLSGIDKALNLIN